MPQMAEFTESLLAHIEGPGLEINILFRKVRDRVRDRADKRQEPFVYGGKGRPVSPIGRAFCRPGASFDGRPNRAPTPMPRNSERGRDCLYA